MKRLIGLSGLALTGAALPFLLTGCPGLGAIPWFRIIGGAADEGAYAVARTADGSFILAGYTESDHDADHNALLLKLSRDGKVLWQSVFGDDRDDAALDVKPVWDGGYIVAGRFGGESDPTSDGFLVKTDGAGAEEWRTLIDSGGEDYAVSVAPAGDGYLAAAQLDILAAAEAAMIAFDESGMELWRASAGEATHPAGAVPLKDGGYVLAAWRLVAGDELILITSEIVLVKASETGAVEWTRTLPYDRALEITDIRATPDGGFVLTGQDDFLSQTSAVGVYKFDADGMLEWERALADDGREIAKAINLTFDGGYIVAGLTIDAGEPSHAFLLKLDGQGEGQWLRTYGKDASDEFHDVLALVDLGFIAVGRSESYTRNDDSADHDIYVVRTGPNGRAPLAETNPLQSLNAGPAN